MDNIHRYWVTDGGATENRGLMSLLMALRPALRNAPESMPNFLRIDGGLGTHWMLPRAVKMNISPDDATRRRHEKLELDTFTVRQVINELHRMEPAGKEQEHKIELCDDESLSWLWSVQERKEALENIHNHMQLHEQPHKKAWQRLSNAWTKGLSDNEIQKVQSWRKP